MTPEGFISNGIKAAVYQYFIILENHGITLKNGRNGIEWLRGKAFAKPDGDSGKKRVTQRKAKL